MNEPAPLIPKNRLEDALIAARHGQMSLHDFLAVLLANDVAMPSSTQVHPNGSGLTPLIFNKAGTEMVAIFTDIDRVKKFADRAQFAVTMNTREFLARLPKGFGVVLNPGYTEGLDISPEGIADILKDFG